MSVTPRRPQRAQRSRPRIVSLEASPPANGERCECQRDAMAAFGIAAVGPHPIPGALPYQRADGRHRGAGALLFIVRLSFGDELA